MWRGVASAACRHFGNKLSFMAVILFFISGSELLPFVGFVQTTSQPDGQEAAARQLASLSLCLSLLPLSLYRSSLPSETPPAPATHISHILLFFHIFSYSLTCLQLHSHSPAPLLLPPPCAVSLGAASALSSCLINSTHTMNFVNAQKAH